ncbi:MAG: addiction module toxin RelE [Thermoguttaceae bacterium]|jgi:mRNA-degrading endonuclease RelE of RelBE toxin-antitoxin system
MPQDFLTFYELDEFADDWKSLGLDQENDLWALQILIMVDPAGSPVIERTGGLRKIRFAPAAWKVGKRGGVRVCYVYFEEHSVVLLVTAYDHSEKENLTAKEREGIREYIRQANMWLSERARK